MGKMIVERCPETGICSLVKGGGDKTDLMPFEMDEIKKLSADQVDEIRAVIAQGNPSFAHALTGDEIRRFHGDVV